MLKNICSIFLLLSVCISLYLPGCKSNNNRKQNARENKTVVTNADFRSLILGFDTLNFKKRQQKIDSILQEFNKLPQENANAYFTFFKALRYTGQRKKDSALLYLQSIHPAPNQADLQTLKDYYTLSNAITKSNIASAEQMNQLLNAIKKSEKEKGFFTYFLYDLAAQSFYSNGNIPKSKEFTKLYYFSNPLKDKTFTKQRYHDIMFMLAAASKDPKQMSEHLQQARNLAVANKDSIALARTFDYEAQLFSIKGNTAASLKASRKFVQMQETHGLLQSYMLNNLATSFVRHGMSDSAFYYYQKAINLAKEQSNESIFFNIYNGLSEAYAKKGDYRNAMIMLDSAFTWEVRNRDTIEAAKVEELHVQYQTEKKDQAIASLQINNALNKKIIKQQWWIFGGVCVILLATAIFIFSLYKQRLLKEKSEKLELENKRLSLEQKTRQMQLDPHFIYNSIANLQGLINTNEKQKANAYLLSFSKLMRNVLELNREEFVSLTDEVNVLQNYIKLQQMRYEDVFDYSIDTDNLDTDDLLIPPMLLQPFIENAIEHGFKAIDYKGMLLIHFKEEAGKLGITIEDNGIGKSEMDSELKEKKSLSTTIIQERIDVLFNKKSREAYFTAATKVPGPGFLVKIFIPLITA